VHTVTLGAYQIGKGEVTNKEYCNVLNWSLAQGYLKTSTGAPWAGTGNIYAGGDLQILLAYTSPNCNIQYSAGVFSSKTRMGLPGTTAYSTDTHPVVLVSWYGSVAFCNWLSQWQGLTPCYDMSAANWPLIAAAGGYRLPTEAEWERAAAWDGSKHWIYGFASDTLTGKNQCNYYDRNPHYVDPLGLTTLPFTSPDAWFNGVNVSPNGSVATINGVSPVGAYDMSGNALEWCHDWYEISYYSTGGPPWNNPTGPADGTAHAVRGGGWYDYMQYCRTAFRNGYSPASTGMSLGFRVAKSN
jgi:formylglycine-generating enzyme required for sulfatase activity